MNSVDEAYFNDLWKTAPPEQKNEPFSEEDSQAEYINSIIARREIKENIKAKFDASYDTNIVPKNEQSSKFKFKTLTDILHAPPAKWQIDNVIVKGSLGFVYAPSDSLKSFFTLAMGMSIATGAPWYGREVEQGGVLYIAGEGQGGLGKRLQAWMMHQGMTNENIPFYCWGDGVDFSEESAVLEFINATVLMGIKMVIIDTLNRSMVGKDENNAKDISSFIYGCKKIQDALGATVIIVHHTGKNVDGGMRGSSALKASGDTSIELDRDEDKGIVKVKCDKQKDFEKFKPFALEIKPVCESIVLELTDIVVKEGKKGITTTAQDIQILEIIKQHTDGIRATEVMQKAGIPKENRTVWTRSKDRLMSAGRIQLREENKRYYYLPSLNRE